MKALLVFFLMISFAHAYSLTECKDAYRDLQNKDVTKSKVISKKMLTHESELKKLKRFEVPAVKRYLDFIGLDWQDVEENGLELTTIQFQDKKDSTTRGYKLVLYSGDESRVSYYIKSELIGQNHLDTLLYLFHDNQSPYSQWVCELL